MDKQKLLKLTTSSDKYFSEVFGLINRSAVQHTIAGDTQPIYQMNSNAVDEVMKLGYEHVKGRYIEHGIMFEDPNTARDKMFLKIAGDALINTKTGVGMLNDPSIYTQSTIPIMLGPYEGSAVYANGGLPSIIIDKKSRAMVLKGAVFKSLNKEFWASDKLDKLEEAAISTGFNDKVGDASTDSFIYGGSILYPVFKKDTP